MKKDFDNWNKIKKELNEKEAQKLYHAREVWWYSSKHIFDDFSLLFSLLA